LAERFEQLTAQGAQSVARFGVRAARRDPFQVERRNHLGQEGVLQGGRQIQGLDLGLHGRKEKGDGGQELDGQALGFGQALAGPRRQIGRVGQLLQPCPDIGKALGDARHGLRLSVRQVIGVIEDSQFTHQVTRVRLTRLGLSNTGTVYLISRAVLNEMVVRPLFPQWCVPYFPMTKKA
jgi:hypothetical protein